MRFINNPGSPLKPVFSRKVYEDGSSELVQIGLENVQDYIQSFEPSSTVSALVARFTSGDTTALNTNTPLYGDFTEAPKTLMEMQQKIIDGQRLFDSLPVDVKAKFDNDINKFLAGSVDPDFMFKLGLVHAASSVENNIEKVGEVSE